MIKIDLHLHSAFSDGVLSPENIVSLLKTKRVSVAALTDHDTANGVERFLAQCRKASIRGVAGVELSAAYDGVLHVLGYNFDVKNQALRSALLQNQGAREQRNILMCRKLQELGFDITWEELKNSADDSEGAPSGASSKKASSVGRPHMARLMWNKGYVPNVRAAFEQYLDRGRRAYVSRPLLPAEECIRLIREAGGFPVLAHPQQTTPDLGGLPPLLSRLKEAGLWGLECWSRKSGPAETYRCLEMAAAFQLFPTAGSDFHSERESASPGVIVEETLLPWARFCGGL